METDEPKRGIRKFLLKRMLFVPFGIVALAATSYARKYPDWAEHVYAQGVYPALSSVVGFLPSLVSFSVAEWVAALFLLFCVGYVVYCVRKLVVSKGERGTVAYRAVMGAVSICCVVYFLFTALCGLNYYRYTFTRHTGYDVEEADVDAAQRQEELVALTTSLADDLGRSWATPRTCSTPSPASSSSTRRSRWRPCGSWPSSTRCWIGRCTRRRSRCSPPS